VTSTSSANPRARSHQADSVYGHREGGECGTDRADGGHEREGESSPSEDDMDQRPACPSVAVRKWVDGLELGMGDGGLRKVRVLIVVHVLDQGRDKIMDLVCRWWNEDRATRVVGAAAYPVLLFANDPSELGPR
jgi:hypothetical protein